MKLYIIKGVGKPYVEYYEKNITPAHQRFIDLCIPIHKETIQGTYQHWNIYERGEITNYYIELTPDVIFTLDLDSHEDQIIIDD